VDSETPGARDPTPQQDRTNLVDDARDQPLAHPVQCLQVELIGVLVAANFIVGRCTASAVASASRKTFLPFCYTRAHTSRDQSRIVTVGLQLVAQVMCADTGLHADQARRHGG